MKVFPLLRLALWWVLWPASTLSLLALGETQIVSPTPLPGGFALVQGGRAAPIFVEAGDWPGVRRAVGDWQADVERVTGVRPELLPGRPGGPLAVLVGTLGRSAMLDTLEAAGRIDLGPLRGRWEANLVQVVEQPWPGLERALVIAGSDKRGTIYGLYGLSEQMGVSPWYWWADVPVRKAPELWIAAGVHGEGEPAVQYRGIFLNDEAPALTNWSREKFGGYNRQFYGRVFELLLRLRANYLWPAMWNSAFNDDDPENPRLADEYGIVMGTSHHEPMIRSQQEWKRYGKGAWDYAKNPEGLARFWSDGVRRNRSFESIVTLGMRGDGDEPMSESENVALLEHIVRDQREILRREVNPSLEKIPQVWALYKEVQGYYERGMRVPDDVILLWCDDNWGNIRRLPTPHEESRPGGAGVYYHFDYVGGPRSYKWLNTNPLPKIHQEMEQAFARRADRLWIVNVGDLKLMEFPTEYFLTLARRPQAWPHDKTADYTRLWAEREFGSAEAAEIAALVEGYARLNGRRKPELLSPDTYSLLHYGEADRVSAEWRTLVERAAAVRARLDPRFHDAYFQLVEFPVAASAQVTLLHIAAARTRLHGLQGRASTNVWADEALRLFAADESLARRYHTEVAGGKWNHIASQTHLGYTYWQQPPRNVMPPVSRIQIPDTKEWALTVEGTDGCWPTDNIHQGPAAVRALERGGSPRQLELFRQGGQRPSLTLRSSQPWLRPSLSEVMLDRDTRIALEVDWSAAPVGKSEAVVTVAGEGREVRVKVPVLNERVEGPSGGAVECDGVVVLEAGAFARSKAPQGGSWQGVKGLGKQVGGLTTLPSRLEPSPLGADGAWVEYDVYLRASGEVKIRFELEPGLDHQPGAAHFGFSFDDEPPVSLEGFPRPGAAWEKAVSDACHVVSVQQPVGQAGWHRLRVWRIDGGVVFQRVVIDRGGLRPSYLGPTASPRLP